MDFSGLENHRILWIENKTSFALVMNTHCVRTLCTYINPAIPLWIYSPPKQSLIYILKRSANAFRFQFFLPPCKIQMAQLCNTYYLPIPNFEQYAYHVYYSWEVTLKLRLMIYIQHPFNHMYNYISTFVACICRVQLHWVR